CCVRISIYILFSFSAYSTADMISLSLHDALPISFSYLISHGDLDQGHQQFFANLINRLDRHQLAVVTQACRRFYRLYSNVFKELDRKSTRLNSSHVKISYAVFCLKKKKIIYYIYN